MSILVVQPSQPKKGKRALAGRNKAPSQHGIRLASGQAARLQLWAWEGCPCLKGLQATWVKTNTPMGSHFGLGAPPIFVEFGGDWDVHEVRCNDLASARGIAQPTAPPHLLTFVEVGVRAVDQESRIKGTKGFKPCLNQGCPQRKTMPTRTWEPPPLERKNGLHQPPIVRCSWEDTL